MRKIKDSKLITTCIENSYPTCYIVNRPEFRRIVRRIAKETGFDICYDGKKDVIFNPIPIREKNGIEFSEYQEFTIYDFFRIEFETRNENRCFFGYIEGVEKLYELMGSFEYFTEFYKSFEKFCGKITNAFNIQWNSSAISEMNHFVSIYELFKELRNVSNEVFYNFEKNEFYIKDFSKVISFGDPEREWVQKKYDYVSKTTVEEIPCGFYIKTNLKGKKLIEELYKVNFFNQFNKVGKREEIINVKNNQDLKRYIPFQVKEEFKNVEEILQKALPGNLFINMFTSIKNKYVISFGPYGNAAKFRLYYFKCEAGYYTAFEHKIYFAKTKNELIIKILDIIKRKI
ncbi:hypothetical protein AAGG74_16025 [Bacillus mexicanus]|uniref:hypothetical protein n=1 Tax=Bacillus mexicanus TaxID=2834415 RepID=UPI003D1BCCE7